MNHGNKPTLTINDILEALDAFHWADRRQITLWLKGKDVNVKRVNMLLRHLRTNKKRKARYCKVDNRYVYALPRKTKTLAGSLSKVDHGLACSECLIRFMFSLRGEAVPERFFVSLGVIPDFGILYEDTILLVEYTSNDQYIRTQVMRGKLSAYMEHLPRFESHFGKRAIVVFVCDVERSALRTDVGSVGGFAASLSRGTSPLPLFFVDYKTFLSVPMGQALQSPIYIYANGEVTSLV